jgi:glycosyltransferase involved in cell wall biosynthesis
MARILWHSCSPWSPSGYGQQTAIWIKELIKMGHEVVVSAYFGVSGSPITWEGIPILPGWGANYCSPSLLGHARAVQPDLIITLGDIWVMDHSILAQLPVAHWLPSDCRPMSLADKGVVEASGSELIAMSRFGQERFISAGFNPVYVPHGIDTDIFSPDGDREKTREAFGYTGKFVVGVNAANNDAIRKALPEMMLAFARFSKRHPDSLLSLHSGIHTDGGQDLEVVAENLGIGDLVQAVDQYQYACGLITPENLAHWYRGIDVLCAATFGEGFGIPIIEAQGCGTPVITTNGSAMPELNPHGISVDGDPFWNGVHKGWWIRPSVSEIEDGLEQAYLSQKDLDRNQIREFALTYDKDVVAEKYMKPAIETLLERKG